MEVGKDLRTSRSQSEILVALSGSEREWLLQALSAKHCRLTSVESLQAAPPNELHHASILFLPHRDSSGRLTASLIRQIRALRPGLHISVCTATGALESPIFARAGADDVTVLFGDHNARGLYAWVEERLSLPMPEGAIEDLVQARGRGLASTIAAWCFRNATRDRPVACVSDWFGLSQRSVRRRLDAARLPHCDTLLRCGRLLHSYELELAGTKSKSRVASALGYSSAHDLWRAKTAIRNEAIGNSRVELLLNEIRALWPLLPHND